MTITYTLTQADLDRILSEHFKDKKIKSIRFECSSEFTDRSETSTTCKFKCAVIEIEE